MNTSKVSAIGEYQTLEMSIWDEGGFVNFSMQYIVATFLITSVYRLG